MFVFVAFPVKMQKLTEVVQYSKLVTTHNCHWPPNNPLMA